MQATVQLSKLPGCNHIIIDVTYEDQTTEKIVGIRSDLNSSALRSQYPILSALRSFIRQNDLQNATNAQIKAAVEAETFEI
jgi:hypothetical protein